MADDENPRDATTHDIFALTQNNLDREENTDFPLDMKKIMIGQQNDRELQRRITSGKFSTRLGTKTIDGGTVTTIDGRVWVPKDPNSRLSIGTMRTFSMRESLERSIPLARRSRRRGYEQWLRSTFSAATVVSVTRLRIRNPTARFHSYQLSAIKVLGRWFISIAAARGR